jgi:SAM-dependent methyltransferase
MKRKVDIVLVVSVVLLGLTLAWLSLDHQPAASSLPPPSPPVRFANEITIRNLTKEWVTYTVVPIDSLNAPALKCLKAGGLEKIDEREGLVIAYWGAGKEKTDVLNSGMPYCFRLDENDELQIYPGSHMKEDAEDLAPYVPSPMEVAAKMLDMAKVGPKDVVYDLGCGDGRIVILAAQKYGARGLGVDIDPQRVEEAQAAAVKAGVAKLAKFEVGDVMKLDFSPATVLTLYLLPESNALLRPLLESRLKPGSRVVSHNYPIPGWESRQIESATVKDSSQEEHSIFLYRR